MCSWRTMRFGRPLLAFALALALGFGSTALRADFLLRDGLDPALEGQEIWVVGVVSSLPQKGAAGTRFRLDVESATLAGVAVTLPRQLALGWYHPRLDDPDALARQDSLRAGQRWRLPVRLRLPHGSLNPGGFDYELWLFEAGVRATGTVRDNARQGAAQWLADAAGYPVERARQTVRDAIYAKVSDPSSAGILAALAIGDQGAIERADWDLFRRTGVAHLMSISGLHVTMFAWLAGRVTGWLWRRRAGAMLWLPAQQAAGWGGLVLAAAYALLAGWGVPAQRTVLMLAVVVVLRASACHWPWPHVLLAAGVAVTAWDPWALLQPGFWLSFAAVGLLMSSNPVTLDQAPVSGWRGALRGHLRAQGVASLGLAPLSLVCFQQVSLVGLGANVLAIPFVTLVLAPLSLAGMLWSPLWTLGGWAALNMTQALAWCASLPGAVWSAGVPPSWALLSGLAAAAVGVLPWPWKLRWLAVPLALPLLLPPIARPADGTMEVLAADIGQGTAVLVRTRHHLLVYDTGPQYTLESDAGQRVLAPLLGTRGEKRIDLLMLSHRDLDHVGGAASLMAVVDVASMSSSLDPSHPLRARGLEHQTCADGQNWNWDGVQFEVLHPAPGAPEGGAKANALSCVLKVTDSQGRGILLTGDIEAAQEAALVERHGERLRSDLLMVPHHGSRTSSTLGFLNAVRPGQAVVQAGYRSRFGHPAPEVVQRYGAQGIELVRTDRCGAWHWAEGASECTRNNRRRYWHWVPPAAGTELAAEGK